MYMFSRHESSVDVMEHLPEQRSCNQSTNAQDKDGTVESKR